MLPVRFRAILRWQPFSSSLLCTLKSRPSRELSFYNFRARRFQYSLFGLNLLPMQFRAIQRRQLFSRTQLCTLISRPSRERSFYNICTRHLPLFTIWPKYATRAISSDFERATFFARAIAHANIPTLQGALFL